MDPITLGTLGMAALSGVIGNHTDRAFCARMGPIMRDLRAGGGGPRNGDLTRAVRRAQVLALRLGVKAYEALPHPRPLEFPGYSPEDISRPVTVWINRALLGVDAGSDDEATQRDVEGKIERVFTHPEPTDGPSFARQEELRRLSIGWTLDEVRKVPTSKTDWPRFETLIRDGGETANGHYPGWWPLFRAFMAEELKSDDRVSAILAEQGIARLLELGTDLTRAVADLQTGFETVIATLGPALAELREASGEIVKSAGRIEGAIAAFDGKADEILSSLERVETLVEHIPEQVRQIFETGQRAWHGVAQDTGLAKLPDARARSRPTALIIARYQITPFVDRGGLLAALKAWATDVTGARAQGRLYVAPGGFGKTRLGAELLAELRGLGWYGTLLTQTNTRDLAPGAYAMLVRGESVAGVCVVVDYAEGQEPCLRDLSLAAAEAEEFGPPIRVLAFARSAEGWWPGFVAGRGAMEVFDPEPIETVAHRLSPQDRDALFDSARTAFVTKLKALGLPCRETGPRPDLAGADRPLVAVASAFLDASGVDRGGRSLFQTLYDEERRHWRRVLNVQGDDAPEVNDLARAAAQVTLVQGATRDGVLALIEADSSVSVLEAPRVLTALQRLYGAHVDSRVRDDANIAAPVFIGAIEPDLLGEHAAMSVLAERPGTLLAATLEAALAGSPLFPQDPRLILTVLTRATRPEHDPGIRQTAQSEIARLSGLAERLPADRIERLADALPETSVSLLDLSAVISSRLVDLSLGGLTDDALSARADRLNTLGVRLSNLGRREAALAATEEAVGLYRELVERNRDAFLPDLAMALNNLGNRLSDLGRREAALEAAEEAVGLYRELVERNRDAFLPDLAGTLNNLGTMLSNLGRREGALVATEEAVGFRRELVERNRDAFLPDLARGLGMLGLVSIRAELFDAAVAAFAEGARLAKSLADARPAVFADLLGHLVGDLTGALRAAGRDDEVDAVLADLGIEETPVGEKSRSDFADAVSLFNRFVERVNALVEARSEPAAEAVQSALDAVTAFLESHSSDERLSPVREALDRVLSQINGENEGSPPQP